MGLLAYDFFTVFKTRENGAEFHCSGLRRKEMCGIMANPMVEGN